MLVKQLVAVFPIIASAAAQTATIILQSNQAGAQVNQTLSVPIGQAYTDSYFNAVSALYLTGVSSGTDANAVTCTPFSNTDGTGAAVGLPFTISSPSILASTGTVAIGSLVCVDGENVTGTGSGASSSSPSVIVVTSFTTIGTTVTPTDVSTGSGASPSSTPLTTTTPPSSSSSTTTPTPTPTPTSSSTFSSTRLTTSSRPSSSSSSSLTTSSSSSSRRTSSTTSSTSSSPDTTTSNPNDGPSTVTSVVIVTPTAAPTPSRSGAAATTTSGTPGLVTPNVAAAGGVWRSSGAAIAAVGAAVGWIVVA